MKTLLPLFSTLYFIVVHLYGFYDRRGSFHIKHSEGVEPIHKSSFYFQESVKLLTLNVISFPVKVSKKFLWINFEVNGVTIL